MYLLTSSSCKHSFWKHLSKRSFNRNRNCCLPVRPDFSFSLLISHTLWCSCYSLSKGGNIVIVGLQSNYISFLFPFVSYWRLHGVFLLLQWSETISAAKWPIARPPVDTWVSMEHQWNGVDRVIPKDGERNLSQFLFVLHKSHMDCPRSGLRGMNPATSSMCCGTACIVAGVRVFVTGIQYYMAVFQWYIVKEVYHWVLVFPPAVLRYSHRIPVTIQVGLLPWCVFVVIYFIRLICCENPTHLWKEWSRRIDDWFYPPIRLSLLSSLTCSYVIYSHSPIACWNSFSTSRHFSFLIFFLLPSNYVRL